MHYFYISRVLSVVAIIYTGASFFQQRKHNRLSLRPSLNTSVFTEFRNGHAVLRLTISNNGIGPAYLKKFNYFHNREHVALSDFESIFSSKLNELSGSYDLLIRHSLSRYAPDFVIKSGDTLNIVTVEFDTDSRDIFESIQKQLNAFDFDVDYECSYKKKYHLDSFDE